MLCTLALFTMHQGLFSPAEHPAHAGVQGTSQVLLMEQGFAVYPRAQIPPSHTHPHNISTYTHTGCVAPTWTLHTHTRASELLRQAWEKTCGPKNRAAFIFLLPPSSSWLFRPPGESQSLSPPTPPTHTHGAGSLHAPSSHANAKSCLGG